MSEAHGMDFPVADADQMRELGERIAAFLAAGDLIVLNGPLGAGKTTLVQGIARGLGVSDPITSPTFVISHIHHGSKVILIHVDAYRLSDPSDLAALDLDEYLDRAVTVVEWGQNLWSQDDPHVQSIAIARSDDSDLRTVSLPHRLVPATR